MNEAKWSHGAGKLWDRTGRFDTLGICRLVADKLEKNPSLLQIGLSNIDRWVVNGADQHSRLRQWEEMIHAAQRSGDGMQRLLCVLREDSERAARMRDFSPFAGVLTTLERRKFIMECAFTH